MRMQTRENTGKGDFGASSTAATVIPFESMAIVFQWPHPAGPIGTEQVLSAPTVTSKGRGQLDVFVVGPDHQLWTKWWSYDTYKWSDWGFLGGAWHQSGPAVASKAAGQLDLFITGDDNQIYTRYYNSRQGWNAGWAAVGAGFQGSPGINQTSPGKATVIARDQFQSLAFKTVDPGDPNAKWYHLQDGFAVSDAPSCTPNLIFARSPNDTHIYIKLMAGNPWGPAQPNRWASIGGDMMSAPCAFAYAGFIVVFAQATDSTLWVNAYGPSGWEGWVQIGDVMASAPAAVSKDNNQIDVLFKGPDGRLWCKTGFMYIS